MRHNGAGSAPLVKRTGGPTFPRVYFYGSLNGSYIKIGYSSEAKLSKRRASLQNEAKFLPTGGGLQLLVAVPGSASDEASVQKYFAAHQYITPDGQPQDEWFYRHTDIVDYVRWLRNQWYSVITEDDDTYDSVSSDLWIPGQGRAVSWEWPEDELSLYPPPERGPWDDLPTPIITVDDFYTDETIIKAARKVLGDIDLDPASHRVANAKFIKAKTIYTVGDNGLLRPWSGRVWLNPPFSQWGEWAPKIESEWRGGGISEMCVLAATRSITAKHFSPVMRSCSAVCIFHGRIPFWGAKATSSPDDGHVVFYFGDHADKFAVAFEELGFVFVPHRAREGKEASLVRNGTPA